MIVERVQLTNMMCFRNVDVTIGAGAWAVIASTVEDPERSNGCGKTAFLEAIKFILTGEKPTSLASPTEDAWITRGESSGKGVLHTWDLVITRSRQRGKSTQLTVEHPDGTAKGEDAQTLIYQAMGFDAEDFNRTVFLAQKKHSEFIIARPADRQEMLTGWLRLEKLEEAERYAGSQHAENLMKAASMKSRIDSIRVRIDFALSRVTTEILAADADPFEALRQERDLIGGRRDENLTKIETLEADLSTWNRARIEYENARKAQSELDKLTEEGKAWRARVETMKPRAHPPIQEMEEHVRTIASRLAVLQSKRDELNVHVTKGFDGQCPVTHRTCPVQDQVLSCAADMQQRLEEWKHGVNACREEHAEALADLNSRRHEANEYKKACDVLTSLRAKHKALQAQITNAADPGKWAHTVDLHQARMNAAAADTDAAMLQEVIVREEEYRTAFQEHVKFSQASTRWKRAQNLLGRTVAQRKVAEYGLAQIEARANSILADSGVPLSIKTSWQRPAASGLSEFCTKCGAPIAESQAVKECFCGEPRAPKQVQKLEVELSDRSGALDDLGGLAMQLSASEWLRDARDAAWSCVMLDEPFAALDRALRKSVSIQLLKMLQSGHWQQAFIISHDAQSQSMMPNRIIIMKGDNGSTVEVRR